LGSFCADAIITCDTGTCNQAVQSAHSTPFTMRVRSPNRFFPLAVGAPRVLLGWGFRAQETHKRMKDKAAHACHALRRAGVADELQRAGERTAESTCRWCSASSTDRSVELARAPLPDAVDCRGNGR
jgi:hypothetical protein